jgi:CBS domain-containing protein
LSSTPRTKRLGDTAAGVGRLELRTERARAVCRPEPLTVQRGTPLAQALHEMQQARGETLLVCEGRRLVGIFTEHDVLTRIVGRDLSPDQPIDGLMTPDPHTIEADATLHQALAAMERGGYRNLPLVEADGTLAGLLRQQDVLSYVAEAFPQEILNLPPRPHQLMEEPEGA